MKAIIDDFTDEDKVISDLNVWNYKEQRELVGVVLKIEPGRFGKKIQLSINEEGDLITLPNLTALSDKLASVEVGNKIKLYWLGTQKSANGRDYEVFDVWIK